MFTLEKKTEDEIQTLEKEKNELLTIKKNKLKDQIEEYEYDDFSRDYRLSLLLNEEKFLKMFDGKDSLLKMR